MDVFWTCVKMSFSKPGIDVSAPPPSRRRSLPWRRLHLFLWFTDQFHIARPQQTVSATCLSLFTRFVCDSPNSALVLASRVQPTAALHLKVTVATNIVIVIGFIYQERQKSSQIAQMHIVKSPLSEGRSHAPNINRAALWKKIYHWNPTIIICRFSTYAVFYFEVPFFSTKPAWNHFALIRSGLPVMTFNGKDFKKMFTLVLQMNIVGFKLLKITPLGERREKMGEKDQFGLKRARDRIKYYSRRFSVSLARPLSLPLISPALNGIPLCIDVWTGHSAKWEWELYQPFHEAEQWAFFVLKGGRCAAIVCRNVRRYKEIMLEEKKKKGNCH